MTLLFISASVPTPRESSTLDQQYLRVLRLIGKQHYNDAIRGLRQMIGQEPGFYRAYAKTVEVYKYKNALDEARQYFEELIVKAPKNAHAYYGLGLIDQEQRDYPQAIVRYRKSIELSNRRAAVYKAIVIAYKKTKNPEGAVNYLSGLTPAKSRNAGAYYGLGYAYMLLKQWENALMALDKALNLNPDLLVVYLEKAKIYYYLGKLQEGLQVNRTGYKMARKHNDVELQYRFLGERGAFLQKLGKYREAQERCQEALAMAREFGDRSNEGKYLGHIAVIYGNMANYSKALEYDRQAVKIAGEVGNKIAEATWLNNMGFVYRNLGQYSEALVHHKRALKIAREIEDKRLEGLNVGNIGSIYLYLAEYSKALTYYQEALAIDRKIKDKSHQGTWLTNIGLCYWNFNDYRKALAYYQQALVILREIGDKSEEGRTLGAAGLAYWRLGDYSNALEYFDKALKIAEEIGDRSGESRNLANIGNIFYSLGRFSRALAFYEKAKIIAGEIGNKSQMGTWLGNIGAVYHAMGDTSRALEYYEKSLKISREIGNKRNEGIFLGNMALVYAQSGNYLGAFKFYKQALKIDRKIGNKNNEGYELNNLGNLNLQLKNYTQSAQNYNKALAMGRKIEGPVIVWEALTGLGMVYEKQRDYDKSLRQYQLAVREIEGVRRLLQIEEQKSSFLENKIQVYGKLINLLAILHQKEPSKGYARTAFEYAERAKARALLDIVCQGRTFRNLKEIPAVFRQKFLMNENGLEKKHLELSNALAKVDSQRDPNRVFTLNYEIEALQQEKAQLLKRISKKYPRYDQLTNPKIVTVEEVQRHILDDKQVLLEYFVADEKIFVWTLTKHSLKFRTIDLTRKELQEKLSQISPLFQKEKAPNNVRIDHRWANMKSGLLYDLYKILVQKPLEPGLEPGSELIIVPDDILHYFPFEILVTDFSQAAVHYLIETYPISYASSASLLNPELQRKKKASEELLALGNPDFSDAQSRGVIEWVRSIVPFKSVFREVRFQPLPYAGWEVKAIAKNFEKPAVFTGHDASEKRFKERAQNYRFIHLATHNIIDDKQPMYSKIILAQTHGGDEDGYLQTYEVYNLRLNADLVVLSGCNTGLGKLSRGEGLIGMTRAFLYAGTPSLVVSLWPVKDESTAELMKSFYHDLKTGMPRNRALQKAKVMLIQSGDWRRDPFYWGAFVLIGDWRSVYERHD